MRTLEEVIAAQSPESQAIIKAMADEMILETGLQMMREELHRPVSPVPGKKTNQ